MTSCGVDRHTGQPLRGWPHVAQSIGVILSTRIGSRVMRRVFGSDVPQLLGENLTERTILRFVTAIIVAIELWEPRFKVKRVDVGASNTAERLRAGRFAFRIIGEYRPRGHQGDPTPEGGERVFTYNPSGALTA